MPDKQTTAHNQASLDKIAALLCKMADDLRATGLVLHTQNIETIEVPYHKGMMSARKRMRKFVDAAGEVVTDVLENRGDLQAKPTSDGAKKKPAAKKK